MKTTTESNSLSEIAIILAQGVLRLHQRSMLDQKQNIPESDEQGLEVPAETVLTVHNG